MLAEVEQHVDHARPHMPRRRQWSRMIPIADDSAFAAAECAINRERQSDGEPMHAPAGTACLIPLDDEVPVVLLNRKMDHPEAIDRRPRDRAPERAEHPGRSKRRQARRCSNRDLHGISGVDLGRVTCGMEVGLVAFAPPLFGPRPTSWLPRAAGAAAAFVPT